MKKKILLSISLLSLVGLASCGKEAAKYQVNVYDIDGEKLGEHKIKINDKKTFVEQLTDAKMSPVTEQSQYGTNINSLDYSIIDSNYYLAFYVNGEYSSVGVDFYTPKKGDVVDFKVECWNTVESGYGTLDETDVLVDKAIYSYIKNHLKKDFTNDTAFSNFFAYINYSLMDNLSYKYVALNSDLSNYLNDLDLSTLTGTDFGKYYYTAKAYAKPLYKMSTPYKAYLDTLTALPEYAEFSVPYILSPAKALGVNSNIISIFKNSTYKPSTEYGYDGANWFYTTGLLFEKSVDTDFLYEISHVGYNNPTSISLSIGSFAASGVNVRGEAYQVEGKDLVEKLLESYDDSLKLIKYAQEDTDVTYSTNQIYTGLISYKLFRDSKEAVNYFA